METKQNYNGDIKAEMEELQKLELTVELEDMAWSTCGGFVTLVCCS